MVARLSSASRKSIAFVEIGSGVAPAVCEMEDAARRQPGVARDLLRSRRSLRQDEAPALAEGWCALRQTRRRQVALYRSRTLADAAGTALAARDAVAGRGSADVHRRPRSLRSAFLAADFFGLSAAG